MEEEAKLDSAKEIRKIEARTKEESEKIAKKIISRQYKVAQLNM